MTKINTLKNTVVKHRGKLSAAGMFAFMLYANRHTQRVTNDYIEDRELVEDYTHYIMFGE